MPSVALFNKNYDVEAPKDSNYKRDWVHVPKEWRRLLADVAGPVLHVPTVYSGDTSMWAEVPATIKQCVAAYLSEWHAHCMTSSSCGQLALLPPTSCAAILHIGVESAHRR